MRPRCRSPRPSIGYCSTFRVQGLGPSVATLTSGGDDPKLTFQLSRRRSCEMLTETARAVRPGGRLVYSTCSSEPEENEEVVARFLSGGGFRPVPAQYLPARMQPLVNTAGHLRTYPFRDGLEAFFGAVLEKAD